MFIKEPLDSYGHITTRMKELVHESDHPEMQRAYSQLASRKWERGHVLKIEHMEKAIREIINKNSAESAMKRFSEFRFTEQRGLSSQVVDIWWMNSSLKICKWLPLRKRQMERRCHL